MTTASTTACSCWDHGNHPIDQDNDQVRWVVQDLEANRGKTFNFVVTHSDELGLIRKLREMNLAEKVVHDFKLKMIICGGQSDWDYHEFAALLNGLPGLHYIRTGQSSTAVRDKAAGLSHLPRDRGQQRADQLCLPARLLRHPGAVFRTRRTDAGDLRRAE